jgi:iron complex outermembrane receptor protein
LNAGLTYLAEDLRLKSGSTDPVGTKNPDLRNDPAYQWTLRSSFDLPRNLQLDFHLHGVGSLPNPAVPAYAELDVQLAWRARGNVELAVTGRNLLHAQHPEFGPLPGRSEIERNVYGQVQWHF